MQIALADVVGIRKIFQTCGIMELNFLKFTFMLNNEGRFVMASADYSTSEEQVAFILRIASDPVQRAEFVADPFKFSERYGVKLDPEFQKIIEKQLTDIEVEAERLGHNNPYKKLMTIKAGTLLSKEEMTLQEEKGPSMNAAAVAAGAAVVSAAAAAVSAATNVYNSTKFVVNPSNNF